MTPLTPRKSQEHGICLPVSEVFGDDTELAVELMSDPSANAEAGTIAESLRREYAQAAHDPTRSYESGASARLAIIRKDCGRCALQGCLVKATLQAAADRRLFQQDSEVSPLSSFALDKGVIRAEREATPVKELVELRGMQLLDGEAKLPTCILHRTSDNPLVIEVIDATSVIANGNVSPARPDQLAVLQRKLSSSATEYDNSGQPQAFNPNRQMIKQLYTQPEGGAKLYEVRVGGKSRLYFMACPPNSERSHNRIILIGSHGDSSQDQRKFIAAAIKESLRPVHKFAQS